jgi:hypothetical protein
VDQWHNCWVIQLFQLFVKFLLPISFQFSRPKPLQCALHVKWAKIIVCTFQVRRLFIFHPLQLLFLDVWGPAPMLSINNNRYYFCIVDDFSKYSWVFLLNAKSDVTTAFLRFQKLVENYFSCKIAFVQSDTGGEFLPLQRHLTSMGVSVNNQIHQQLYIEQTYPHNLL